jgi:FixJ family two-component response regulator
MTSTASSGIRSVYIVDDDAAVRDSIKWLMKSARIPAVGFQSADEFLEKFDPELAGCILLDQHMPGMSGLELLELLRGRGIKTPIIMISGRRDPLLDDLVKRAGALAILSKPVGDDELLALIQQAINSQPE